MLPSETMIWQPEFTDKTLSRKPGAVHIDNIRGALHYLAKEEQKDGLCAYGCSEVPERPAAGRPRKLQK